MQVYFIYILLLVNFSLILSPQSIAITDCFTWLQDCSDKVLVVLITPPPIDEDGRFKYARYNVVNGEQERENKKRFLNLAFKNEGMTFSARDEMCNELLWLCRCLFFVFIIWFLHCSNKFVWSGWADLCMEIKQWNFQKGQMKLLDFMQSSASNWQKK